MRPHRWQPTRLPRPWDSPGKNTGVGCHFLLQCMKVKSESEVAQSCLTLCGHMDCSLPGSSIHGIFQARVLEWGGITTPKIVKFFIINYFEMLLFYGSQKVAQSYREVRWIFHPASPNDILLLFSRYIVSDSFVTPWTAAWAPVYGISQARLLEWVAISSSRESSWPKDRTSVSCIGRQILYHWASREAPSDILFKQSILPKPRN